MAGEKQDYLEGQKVKASTFGSIKRRECRLSQSMCEFRIPGASGCLGYNYKIKICNLFRFIIKYFNILFL